MRGDARGGKITKGGWFTYIAINDAQQVLCHLVFLRGTEALGQNSTKVGFQRYRQGSDRTQDRCTVEILTRRQGRSGQRGPHCGFGIAADLAGKRTIRRTMAIFKNCGEGLHFFGQRGVLRHRFQQAQCLGAKTIQQVEPGKIPIGGAVVAVELRRQRRTQLAETRREIVLGVVGDGGGHSLFAAVPGQDEASVLTGLGRLKRARGRHHSGVRVGVAVLGGADLP